MNKIINITDKLSTEKPKLKVGEKVYAVEDSMATVMKFEELASAGTTTKILEAIELALGKEAVEELDVKSLSIGNFKVIMTAILAAMQGIDYDEAEARFPK